jgi:hypothetical protein
VTSETHLSRQLGWGRRITQYFRRQKNHRSVPRSIKPSTPPTCESADDLARPRRHGPRGTYHSPSYRPHVRALLPRLSPGLSTLERTGTWGQLAPRSTHPL